MVYNDVSAQDAIMTRAVLCTVVPAGNFNVFHALYVLVIFFKNKTSDIYNITLLVLYLFLPFI